MKDSVWYKTNLVSFIPQYQNYISFVKSILHILIVQCFSKIWRPMNIRTRKTKKLLKCCFCWHSVIVVLYIYACTRNHKKTAIRGDISWAPPPWKISCRKGTVQVISSDSPCNAQPDSQQHHKHLCLIKYKRNINVFNFETNYFLMYFQSCIWLALLELNLDKNFNIFDQINVSRITMWIGHCHHCLKGYITKLQS